MYIDDQLTVSKAQAVTTGTQASDYSVDLLASNVNLGRGQPMRLFITCAVAFTGGTSVTPQIIQSANADLSSPDVLATGPTVVEANLTAGKVIWDTAMPDNLKRYVGVQYVSVGTHTAGKVLASFVAETDYNPSLPANTGRGA